MPKESALIDQALVLLPDYTDEQYAIMAEDAVCLSLGELGGSAQLGRIVRKTVGIGEHNALAALGRCVDQGRVALLHFNIYKLLAAGGFACILNS